MQQVPRRMKKLDVAIPASLTLDVPHLREKTARIGQVARILATFRVDSAIIYPDQKGERTVQESRIFEKILSFQETPQYLRKHLFAMDPDLRFAGVLPPLRSPHHPDKEGPRPGQLREAVVVSEGRESRVDAGFSSAVRIVSRLDKSRRLTVRITRTTPSLEGEQVDPSKLHIYWGFNVSRETRTLGEIVKEGRYDLAISTSKKGTDIRQVMERMRERWRSSRRTLLLFGSPREGVPEILAREHAHDATLDFNVNTIPAQGVETVRTEEALLGTLAILNLFEED